MKLRPCGDVGLLVELDDLGAVLGLYERVGELDVQGIQDLVPASRTLLIRVDPTVVDLATVARAIEGLEPGRGRRDGEVEVEVPVVYDGEDLARVGELTGLGVDGVIEAHTASRWTVAFTGFAPGFGYLVGGDERLRVPRRTAPRSAVPAGSVGLADDLSGIYPRRSPGGWQLIGRTDLPMWDADRDPPALLEPGAGVRFVAVR